MHDWIREQASTNLNKKFFCWFSMAALEVGLVVSVFTLPFFARKNLIKCSIISLPLITFAIIKYLWPTKPSPNNLLSSNEVQSIINTLTSNEVKKVQELDETELMKVQIEDNKNDLKDVEVYNTISLLNCFSLPPNNSMQTLLNKIKQISSAYTNLLNQANAAEIIKNNNIPEIIIERLNNSYIYWKKAPPHKLEFEILPSFH